MTARLPVRNPFRIVAAAMRKPAFLLALLALAATPVFAQSSEFGVLIGGSKRLVSDLDSARGEESDSFKFSNSVKEVYWSVELEPGTRFRIKGGQISGPVGFRIPVGGTERRFDVEGEVEHVDALVEYRFSEPFGQTGIFAGVGYYRQHGTVTDPAIDEGQRSQSETDYGFSGGITADFPITRRYGFVAEGTYHWVNYSTRPRYLTLSGGLRISF